MPNKFAKLEKRVSTVEADLKSIKKDVKSIKKSIKRLDEHVIASKDSAISFYHKMMFAGGGALVAYLLQHYPK